MNRSKLYFLFSFFLFSSLFFPTSVLAASYYVSPTGNDTNSGAQASPWLTIQKAVKTVVAGDTIFVRGGQYPGIKNGWVFQNSGTQAQPITLTNYPGEQAIIKHTTTTNIDYEIFRCSVNPRDPLSGQTPKADYIHIVGTDVAPSTLSNGVSSKKGIVIQGLPGEQSYDINAADCDYWEVAGVDFVETAGAIRTWKNNWQTSVEHSADHWYVHDNRVQMFYRESGMQFNGDYNRVENNEINKATGSVNTPYGCQMLNFLGHNNTIRGNTLSRQGSTADCIGILFEWDLADNNIVEQNKIFDVVRGINIQGGDNNIIRNNVIYSTGSPNQFAGGIEIHSYDGTTKTDWPCDELKAGSSALSLVPANDPTHPDYQYFYNPRNCHSSGNQIYNNTIHGFVEGIRIYPLAGESTVIRNNAFSAWTRGIVCFYEASNGTCKALPVEVTADHNTTSKSNFGFVNLGSYDFHLASGSPLIDAGVNLGLPYNGSAPDIGAFEYQSGTPTPTPTPTPIPGDLNNDGHVNILDFRQLLQSFTSIFNLNTIIINYGK